MTRPFSINSGVRQGDAVSIMIFNLVLEAAIRKVGAHEYEGTRTMHIWAYIDEVITSRDKKDLA